MKKDDFSFDHSIEKHAPTFLAIDIGASSGRHILGTFAEGRLTLREIHRFSNSPLKVNSRLIWDTGRLFTEILQGMRRASQLGYTPKSVAIDTWAVDYVLLDRAGEVLRGAYSYRDAARWQPAAEAVHAAIPFAELYRRTGIQYQPFNTIYQLSADAAEGILAQAEHLLMLPEYFYYLLTGNMVREATNASSTGLIAAHGGGWDGEIARLLGFPERLFPALAAPGLRLGGLRKEVREYVGYDCEAVLCATHDTASAVIGSLAEEGEHYLSSGTWSLLGSVERGPHTDAASMAYNFSNEGHVGGKFRLQKNIMGLWMLQRLRAEECPGLDFEALTEEARNAPLRAQIDANDARFLAPAHMKREIEAAAGGPLTTAECARCILEGLAACYARTIDELQALTGRTSGCLNIMGGGSKNVFLNELTAQATGKRIICGPAEATVAGNLAVQMASLNAVQDLKAARAVIARSAAEGLL